MMTLDEALWWGPVSVMMAWRLSVSVSGRFPGWWPGGARSLS